MSTGGSILEVSIKDRVFSVAADADLTVDIGGYSGETQMNGDGTGRPILTRKAWSITGITININEAQGDHDFLQDCMDGVGAGDDGYFDCTVTFTDGRVRQGRGKPQGELAKSTMNTTAAVAFGGPGKLELQ
jgi:phosphate-selective porin